MYKILHGIMIGERKRNEVRPFVKEFEWEVNNSEEFDNEMIEWFGESLNIELDSFLHTEEKPCTFLFYDRAIRIIKIQYPMIKYLFATKGQKVICIQYTDHAILELWEHLYQRGYKVEACEEMYYRGKIDRYGGRVQTYFVDANTKLDF